MSDLSHRLQDALADRYRIERMLGRGGMATVYLAEDLRHHRQVAIKVLDPEVAAAIGPERFLREIETVARLTHPHILPLHDSGTAGGLLFYVMPYIEGESLRDRLSRERQLPLEDALRIAREVADALSYAHSRGLIHRDIKPENILLESGHAVVADFGIARAAAAGGEQLTATGVAVGTAAYMSPEQAAGSRDLDGRSDLYSLACVLYEMLAGVPPFAGTTAESLAHQHLNVPPRAVTEIRPAVPAAVVAALQRALAKAPADRFNPVAQFGEALGSGASAAATMTAGGPAAPLGAPRTARSRIALVAGTALVLAAVAAVLWMTRGRREPSPVAPATLHGRTEIAVLPFQNLSAEGPNAYFAGGLHDELLTQLAKVAALKVISRTSVMGYVGTTKSLGQIAAELGVGSIVEGTVQVVGGRLRVNVQLIDAATDEHLWAERYDRTLDDAFAIQSDVAQQIVAAVGVALTSAEQGRLAAAATANAEAYRLYLQGREYYLRLAQSTLQNAEIPQRLFERALALDPGFALAHAALSQVHGWAFWFRRDPSAARAARQRDEAEAALRLAPDLPQAHMAMGLAHYWGRRDYRGAQEEFAIALEGLPNDAEIWSLIAFVHRRLGNWKEAVAALERAGQLDPRSAIYLNELGNTHEVLHRPGDAIRAFDRALSLAPDMYEAAVARGQTYVRGHGQLDSMRAALDRIQEDADIRDAGNASASPRPMLLLWHRDGDGLLRILQVARAPISDGQTFFIPAALYAAWAHQLRGDQVAARAAFDSARVRLDSALRELPDDWRVHAAHGMALAGLGRRDEALREARWLQRSVAYREDAFGGPDVAEDRARILAQADDADAALDEIERLLAGPSWLSVHTLRLDPRWDPIREHPRFKALLAKYRTAATR